MRAKGIAYDTGFVRHGEISLQRFDLDAVRRDLAVIRDDLHCNAVHLVGGDPERLERAAEIAAGLGLEIWFSPYPLELTPAEILDLLTDCARRAERIRMAGAEVVFVTGVELSIMNSGFLPGDDVTDRLSQLLGQPRRMQEAGAKLNEFLAQAVAVVREHFRGRLTYACIPFENPDWDLFDIKSFELIRSAEVADVYAESIRNVVAQGKPVAITGFGTAAWHGSGAVAPRSMEIVEHDEAGTAVRVKDGYVRDEAEQATYLREVLETFEAEGVDGAFVYMFALGSYPHRPDDPTRDLDMASPGVVKVFEDLSWEPKAAFGAVAEVYARI
ncbi:hypothetical protein [Lentzea flaviverrucosa]|uniref:Abortive infection protein n=1 Tax=Lentzea flaviverrucosa TaxID=200379 RepID=A0A1H9VVF1_9PSEU|nr:hypothetical protein [Lentzea flaviverrucosa]RDI23609.1 hypothetical protein DFR72_11014 [Lentzea flaviverrucosa]SES25509.1 hypothetical protein SAMN05216195_110321 [Lentzea flaviverrucosa]